MFWTATPGPTGKLELSFATPLHVVHWQAHSNQPAFTFESGNFKVKGEHMSASMQVGTYATVSVEWKDKGGNPVKVDGPTKWESSDSSICAVEVATGNPQIANLFAAGNIGKAQVQATADADLGEGYKAVTASLEVEVISGEAVGGEITFTQAPAQSTTAAATSTARKK